MRAEPARRRDAGIAADRAGRPEQNVVARAAACLLVLAVGCGGGDGGNGMDTDDRPTALVRVSVAEDTLVADDSLEDPLTVRVENASGRPLSGVSVSFEVVTGTGTGSVDPDAASTDGSGEAATTFVAANASGNARVRAALPEAPDVEPVTFDLQVVPPGLVRLQKVSGDGQEAEPGSQLPDAFEIRTVAGDNDPVGGVRVVWAVTEAPPADNGASLTADTVFSDADGHALTVLTLADSEGEHRVRAVATGQADTVRFQATAAAGAVGGIRLDSVRPSPLQAGAGATVFGSGFGEAAPEVTVTVEGIEASVTSASDDRLEIEVPAFRDRCLPARSVGVRARSDDRLSNGITADLRPVRSPLGMAPGEARVLTAAGEVRCLQFPASDGEREYRMQVQSAARTITRTPMRLVARTGPSAGAAPDLQVVGRRREAAFADRSPEALASRRELALRENIREELRRIGARPAREDVGGRDGGLRAAHRTGPPALGDTLGLNFYVRPSLSITCEDTLRRIGAEVRAVGERVVLAEDTLARQVDGFDDADYEALRDEFDQAIFAADSAYFGSPTDIDHNERVIVLITPEVNMLSPGEGAIITGFFNSADLADSGDTAGDGTTAGGTCATSNEGELLYLLAPDPSERWGPQVTLAEARQYVRGTAAHEHQHLINAGTRLIEAGGDFGDLLDTWLDEGLSHVAEEVVGMRLRGAGPRQNLGYDEAGGGTEDFDAYFLQNLLRLGIYHRNPSDTRTLSTSDPGGLESLEMRGFAWSFLRWLADTRVPDGSGGFLGGPREEELFRALAGGGPQRLTGVDNLLRALEQVTGERPAWGELVAQFSPVAHVDDDVEGVSERFTFPSWDLRDALIEVGGRTGQFTGYPLRFTDAGFDPTAYEFEVRGSTQAYFRFASSGPAPSLSLELANRLGGPVPASAEPQITVVRVR